MSLHTCLCCEGKGKVDFKTEFDEEIGDFSFGEPTGIFDQKCRECEGKGELTQCQCSAFCSCECLCGAWDGEECGCFIGQYD